MRSPLFHAVLGVGPRGIPPDVQAQCCVCGRAHRDREVYDVWRRQVACWDNNGLMESLLPTAYVVGCCELGHGGQGQGADGSCVDRSRKVERGVGGCDERPPQPGLKRASEAVTIVTERHGQRESEHQSSKGGAGGNGGIREGFDTQPVAQHRQSSPPIDAGTTSNTDRYVEGSQHSDKHKTKVARTIAMHERNGLRAMA